jgi:hypothetical protein
MKNLAVIYLYHMYVWSAYMWYSDAVQNTCWKVSTVLLQAQFHMMCIFHNTCLNIVGVIP